MPIVTSKPDRLFCITPAEIAIDRLWLLTKGKAWATLKGKSRQET